MYTFFLQMTEEERRTVFNKMIASCTYDNFNQYMAESSKEDFFILLDSFFLKWFLNEKILEGNKND